MSCKHLSRRRTIAALLLVLAVAAVALALCSLRGGAWNGTELDSSSKYRAHQRRGVPPAALDVAQPMARFSWTISGSVRSTRGAPLPSASVCAMVDRSLAPKQCVNVEASGQFELAQLDPEVRLVIASAPRHVTREYAVSAPTPASAEHETMLLELDPGGATVSGAVIDVSGGYVGGALVSAVKPGSEELMSTTVSNAEGLFELSVLDGPAALLAEADAYSLGYAEIEAPAHGVTLAMAPAGAISGVVVADDTRAPLSGVAVTAKNGDGLQVRERTTVSADDGTFQFGALPPGRYEISAASSEWASARNWVAIGVGEVSTPLSVIVSRATTLTAVVQLDGKPCLTGYLEVSGPKVSVAQAGSDQTVHLQGLPPGHYQVGVACIGQSHEPFSDDLELGLEPVSRVWNLSPVAEGDQQTEHREPAGTLRASTTTAAGVPVSAPMVWARMVWATQGRGPGVRGQRRGSCFVFENLQLGEYEVYVDGATETRQRVLLSSDKQLVEVSLKLPAYTQISGRVLDEANQPMPDVWVRATNTDALTQEAPGTPVLSDADGAFSIPNLLPGRYAVDADGRDGRGQLDGVRAGAEGVEVHVTPHGTLSGVTLAASGHAEPSSIYCRRQGDSEVHMTNSGAQWTFPWLPAGGYDLFVIGESGSAARSVTLKAGSKLELSVFVEPMNKDLRPTWVKENSR
jgi:carboxypeptidase family protein